MQFSRSQKRTSSPMRRLIHSLLNIAPAVHRYVITKLRARFLRYRYAIATVRIRRKSRRGEQICVLFLVNETAKWKSQALFDLLSKDPRYKVSLALSIGDTDMSLSPNERAAKVSGMASWFEKRGVGDFVVAYDCKTDKALPLDRFMPDIVFYHQPWFIPPCQMPRVVSRFALTCYIPYFVPTFANNTMHCQLQLHKDVFRHFVLNETWKAFYEKNIESSSYAGELIAAGHPMLDAIAFQDRPAPLDSCVIYAPHWSIPHPKNPSELNLSTFMETGLFILDYAKRHPDVKWVFRPHPTLALALKRTGLMNDKAVEDYYSEWGKIGRVSQGGDYAKLFNESRLLITDCDSFLSEYACTGNPIVHLVSPVKNNRHYSPLKPLFDTYYKVADTNSLSQLLDDLVVAGNDPKRNLRHEALERSGLARQKGARNILMHLNDLCFSE